MEAEDALQDPFLKAFQHLANFEGRSRFSTWLGPDCNQYRAAANEKPEEFYSREEIRRLVEREVMKLPVKYRVALMLRDLEELSTEEAAAALGLSVPGLKARVLRGRLMLRESMVPYFSKAGASKS